jgi:hypothetical protein
MPFLTDLSNAQQRLSRAKACEAAAPAQTGQVDIWPGPQHLGLSHTGGLRLLRQPILLWELLYERLQSPWSLSLAGNHGQGCRRALLLCRSER